MTLKEFLNSLPVDQQRDYAVRCATSLGYLRNSITTGKTLGASLCVLLEQQSDGLVSRRDLREDWRSVWPELA